jgi:creatinine amidohydrolase/Fe(II)-dependent formamide hydrolase-like protein
MWPAKGQILTDIAWYFAISGTVGDPTKATSAKGERFVNGRRRRVN